MANKNKPTPDANAAAAVPQGPQSLNVSDIPQIELEALAYRTLMELKLLRDGLVQIESELQRRAATPVAPVAG